MNKSDLKRYLQFLLVIVASGAIFPLVYLKAQYQETILMVYDMSIQQLNTIFVIMGFVFVIGYFPSGILSDKFSAKGMLVLSLLGTAAGGIWFAQVPSYGAIIVIFSMWGFFTGVTFWGAHLKVVKMLAKPSEEGRFFGILDGGKGLIEAVLASIALAIFTAVLGGSDDGVIMEEALLSVVYMYIAVLVAAAVLVIIFVKEVKTENTEVTSEAKEESKFKFSDVGKIFKNKYVYYQGIIVFAGYTLFWTNYYFSGYLQTNLEISLEAAGTIMVIILWMRPIGGTLGGIMADKIGNVKTIRIVLTAGCIGLLVLSLAPASLPVTFFSGAAIISGLVFYMIRATFWTLLGESNIEPMIMGTAIGVISVMGFVPDIILPYVHTFWTNMFGAAGGNTGYFITSVCIGAVGIVATVLYSRSRKLDKQKSEGK